MSILNVASTIVENGGKHDSYQHHTLLSSTSDYLMNRLFMTNFLRSVSKSEQLLRMMVPSIFSQIKTQS